MSFSRRQFVRAIAAMLFILLAVLLVAVISGAFVLSNTAKYGMIVMLFLGYFLYPFIVKIGDWVDRVWLGPIMDTYVETARRARRGFEGEDTVNSWLENAVSKESILKNLEFEYESGKKFDIDFIIVSEKGVIVIEAKNLSDELYFENRDCYRLKDGRKYRLSLEHDPRNEVERHASYLRSELQIADVYAGRVYGVLVFSNGKVSWSGSTGTYLIQDVDSLRRYIAELPIDPLCVPETQEKIKQFLKGL